MSAPYQIVPSFISAFLTADQTLPGVWTTILFDIVETDGSTDGLYSTTTGTFTAPISGWYDVEVELLTSVALTGLRVIRNSDGNFPLKGTVPSDVNAHLRARVQLGKGETLNIQGLGAFDVLALAGTVPDMRVSNVIITLVKRYIDSKLY